MIYDYRKTFTFQSLILQINRNFYYFSSKCFRRWVLLLLLFVRPLVKIKEMRDSEYKNCHPMMIFIRYGLVLEPDFSTINWILPVMFWCCTNLFLLGVIFLVWFVWVSDPLKVTAGLLVFTSFRVIWALSLWFFLIEFNLI